MANYKNVQRLLPANDNRTYGKMDWQYVTIHNTANRMPAKNEVSYVHSGQGEVTYHFAIDDKECIQLLPLDKSAWHAGDGRGKGNTKSVAIEICYSLDKGDKRYPMAEDNASHKAAELLYSKGFGVDRLRKHQDWSGKYCPHRMLDNGGWGTFKNKVQGYLNELNKPVKKEEKPTLGGEMKKKKMKYGICYVDDGDLANALGLLNILGNKAFLTRTSDATDLPAENIIQIGGSKVNGATIVLSGKNRQLTQKEITNWVNKNF